MVQFKNKIGKVNNPNWDISNPTKKTLRSGKQGNLNKLELSMLGLGGAIGSGIFVASSIPISLAGPGVILVFILAGIINMFILQMIAEMGVIRPATGSFSTYAEEYLGQRMGFITGWSYWTAGVLSLATEMIAAALLARWWFPNTPIWTLGLFFILLVVGINLLDVRSFARIEEGLSFVKVGVLGVIILIGLIILVGLWPGFLSPGFSNYLSHGGFFPTGIQGLLSSFLLVTFTYSGGQVIGLAIPDVDSPNTTVPKAVRLINIALIVLYLGSITVLIGLRPWNSISLNGSGFVPLFQGLGIPGVAGFMNAVILSAVLSAMNSNMFGVPRMLKSLAERGEAPDFLASCNKNNVPVPAILFSTFFLIILVFLSYLLPKQIFTYIASATGATILLNWIIITMTYLRFRSQGNPNLIYSGHPYTTYGVVSSLLIILSTSAYNHGQMIGLLIGVLLFGLYALIFSFYKNSF